MKCKSHPASLHRRQLERTLSNSALALVFYRDRQTTYPAVATIWLFSTSIKRQEAWTSSGRVSVMLGHGTGKLTQSASHAESTRDSAERFRAVWNQELPKVAR